MEKRLTFRCWNCGRKYSLFKEITDRRELIVACPFCNKETVVKLEPYRMKTVFRGGGGSDQAVDYEYQPPDVIPTQPHE